MCYRVKYLHAIVHRNVYFDLDGYVIMRNERSHFFNLQIRQEEVRHFNRSVRPRPPKCEFEVTWKGGEDAHPLPHIKFNFKGAKPPRNYCQLQLSR